MITVLPSKAYEKWEDAAQWFVKSEIVGMAPFPLECPVLVRAICYYKGPEPDLSGCEESVGDAFEGILWANDKQIMSWDGSRKRHDLKNPRTVITVRWAP